jgi:hypothetical protein
LNSLFIFRFLAIFGWLERMKPIPPKRPVDATSQHLAKALQAFVKDFQKGRGIPPDSIARLNTQITSLSNARSGIGTAASSAALLESLNVYLSMLIAISTNVVPQLNFAKTGSRSGQYNSKTKCLEVIWSWNEAFKRDKTAANFDIEYEKFAVVFCIGCAYSQLAADETHATTDGLKQRAVQCLKAAGVFQYLEELTVVTINSWGSQDLSRDVILFLKELMIAEAAGATFLNVLASGKSAKALKVVAQGAYERFEAADRAMNTDLIKNYILRSMSIPYKEYVRYCSSYFRAEAMYHASQDALAASKYGEEISRLKAALQMCESCSKAKYVVDYLVEHVQNLVRKIKTRLPGAEKDNNSIYIDKVPDAKELDDVEARVLGKPSAFEMPAADTTLFSALEMLKDIPPDVPDVKEDPFEAGLKQLKDLGYSEGDSKKALKANNNDLVAAIEFLSKKTQEEEEAKKAKDAKDSKSNDKPSASSSGGFFGLFGSSSFIVDEEMVQQFVELGFTQEQARTALTKSKNDFTKALDSMSQSVEEPAPAPAPVVVAPAAAPAPLNRPASSANIAPASGGKDAESRLIAMGFPREQVQIALAASNNDFDKAVDVLSSLSLQAPSGGAAKGGAVDDLASAPSEELPDYMSSTAPVSSDPKHEKKKSGGGGGFFGLFGGKKSDKKPDDVKSPESEAKTQLLALGFESSNVDRALAANGNDFSRALDQLTREAASPPATPSAAAAPASAAVAPANSGRAKLTQQLVYMGYSEKQAEAALLLSNDNFAAAVTLLAKQAPAGGPSGASPAPAPSRSQYVPEPITPEMKMLMEMGFPKDRVKDALQRSNNNVDQALQLLM